MIDKIHIPNNIDGSLTLQTIAMANDSNANGDIFGGWIFSQMDLGGAAIANTYSPSGRTVTIAVDNMQFHKKVIAGNLISCFAKFIKKGNKSVTFKIQLWVYDYINNSTYLAAEGDFTYVAIDNFGATIQLKDT